MGKRFNEFAYYDGEDHLRCTAAPSDTDVEARPEMTRGVWGCALPEGHEEFANPRHQPHSWALVED